MFNTRAEAQAKADDFNNNFQYVKAYAIEMPHFNFQFKYKVAFIPASYAEQYQNATLELKYLFHFGTSSTFSSLLNSNNTNLYNNENIKSLYDAEVTTQPELIDLKNYLGL